MNNRVFEVIYDLVELVNGLTTLGVIWSLGLMAFVFGTCWLIVWDRRKQK